MKLLDSIIIDVTDYGANPTENIDNAKAIYKALQACSEKSKSSGKNVILNFPKGEYHIYKDYSQEREYHTSNTNSIENPVKTITILIENQKNITIEGNGSIFIIHGNMMALAVVKSQNIKLQNFSWDFAVPTVSEMRVDKLGELNGHQYTDFHIAKCFPYEIQDKTILWKSELSPYTNKTYWTETGIHRAYSVIANHPDKQMTRAYFTNEGPFEDVYKIDKLDDTSVRIFYNNKRPKMQQEGMILELASSTVRETAGAFIWESKNVYANNIDVHFMHGFGWLVQMSENVYYKNCNLMPRENSQHLTVSYADGIHVSGASGEILIEDCNFSNTHDDPINIHGTFTRVEERIDDHTLKLKYIHNQQGGFTQYYVGDKVQFFTRDTLQSTDNETAYEVLKVINPNENGNDLRTMIVEFKEKLPVNLSDTINDEPKYVAENITYTPKVTIRNCTFKNVPTRAILCTTRKPILIEKNIFYNMSMATIFLSNDSDEWYESGPIRNIVIRDNIFYIKDIGRTSWKYAPAIYIHPVTKNGDLPSASNPIHKNITIEGNTFYMDLDTVVKAESVENLVFRNNKVLRMNPNIKLQISLDIQKLKVGQSQKIKMIATGNKNDGKLDNLFEFTKSKNILIENNSYDGGLKKYVVVYDKETSDTITIKDDIKLVTELQNHCSNSVENITYKSTNQDIAIVDCKGNIIAKKSGITEVYAYYLWDNKKIYSNTILITVE